MVLHLKVWKSKSLPGLLTSYFIDAGWSSPVARQAHNLKGAGSNPAPATKKFHKSIIYKRAYGFWSEGFFCFYGYSVVTFIVTCRQAYSILFQILLSLIKIKWVLNIKRVSNGVGKIRI